MATRTLILLVEDNQDDTELALYALGQCDLADKVTTVRDGAEALDYLYHRGRFTGRKDGNPVVVMLDLKMPKVSGFEVLQQIKCDPDLSEIPVVVITSSGQDHDIAATYRLGVNAYVVKPINFHDYTNTIKELASFWTQCNVPPPGSRN